MAPQPNALETAARRPVVIVGAGALGSLLGARLVQAGQAVVLVGRAAQAQAIQQGGLTVHDEAGTQVLTVPATTDIGVAGRAGLVLLCVKSGDTENAACDLAASLLPDTPLLSLQNGVANAPLLALRLQRTVLVGAAYIAAALEGPGVVRHAGGRSIVMGAVPGPQGHALPEAAIRLAQQQLQAAGFDVSLSTEPEKELWRKLTINCACNAISALAQAPYGVMAAVPAVRELQHAVVREAVAVALAEGHALALEDILDAVDRVAQTMSTQRSSTAQDLARGRRSEVEHINGEVLRAGARHGIATPANHALWALVKLHEAMQAQTHPA